MNAIKTVRRKPKQGARMRSSRSAATVPLYWLKIGRQWLGLLMLLGLLIIAAQQGQKLMDAQRFPLRYVHLQGEWQYLDPAHVQKVVMSQPAVSFFILDIEQIQQHLNALPWIESANVSRRWPDGLDINLKERTIYARWGEGELIDPNGQRFRPEVIPDDGNWPLLYGPTGQERQVLKLYQLAQQRLRDIDLSIAQLEQDVRGAWRLQLGNGLELKLGKIQLLQRLERFVVLYPRVLQSQLAEIAEVDLRYSSGLAVRWNQLSSTLPFASTAANRWTSKRPKRPANAESG